MVKIPMLTQEHKDLIVDALLSVMESKICRGVTLDKTELTKLQECMKIVDNWKGGDNYAED